MLRHILRKAEKYNIIEEKIFILWLMSFSSQRILKEYIEGDTIYEYVLREEVRQEYVAQMREWCRILYAANINIDYFPTNFIVQDDLIFYIDYECNNYMEEWNFENWGIKYWSKTPEFIEYMEQH